MGLEVAKCTMGFTQNQQGWTESYFLNTPSSTLDPEMVKLRALATKRIALSGASTYITSLKVSNEAKQRDVRVEFYAAEEGAVYRGSVSHESDMSAVAYLNKRVNDAQTKISPLYMRGLWDELVYSGGFFQGNDPAFNAAYNSWRAMLVNDAWGFLAKSDATPARQAIVDVTQDVNGYVGLQTTAPVFDVTQVGAKAKIFVSGVNGAAIINGSQIVNVLTTTTAKTVKRIPMFPYTGGGFLSNSIPAFFDIADVYRSRVVERKAGRPLYQSRGRARARVYA